MDQRQYTVNSKAGTVSRKSAGDAFSAFVVRVFQLNGMLVAAGDSLVKPTGQTSARWQVLAAVQDAPASVAQIARVLSLARQSVQRVADLLESDGLATYVENPAHRRAKLLRLTMRGHSVLRAIQALQRPWANALGEKVGEAHLQKACILLERILQLMDDSE
jgi:DNA-binding MarR family transcriptional regulator